MNCDCLDDVFSFDNVHLYVYNKKYCSIKAYVFTAM